MHPRGAQRRPRADHDAAVGGVEPHHVERLAGGDAEPAALADGEIDDAGMAAEHPAVEIDDLARLGRARHQALDQVGIAPGRHETDVLAVGLVGDRQREAAGELAGLRLGEVAERKAQEIDLLAGGGEQEIALVAVLVAGAVERAAAAGQRPGGDVMAGRQHARAPSSRAVVSRSRNLIAWLQSTQGTGVSPAT